MLGSSASLGSQNSHLPALDGVRALSIILVILTHTMPLGPAHWRLNSMAGPMGMSLFFCLSGFLIVSIIHRNPDPVSFLIRRIFRIFPAVALYILIIIVLFGLPLNEAATFLFFVMNYFPVQNGVFVPTSHLWSLAVEMHFYILIGGLTFIFGRRAVWFVPAMAFCGTAFRIEAGVYVDIATHLRADEIMAGGCLALVYIYQRDRIRAALENKAFAWALLFGVGGLWVVSCHPEGGAMNYARPYLAATLVGVVIHSRMGLLHTALEGRISAYIARISYALYIYHPLMIFGWMNTGGDWTRYLLKRPVSFVLTWGAAHCSTYFWERPWQDLAKRLTKRHTSYFGKAT